MYLLNESGHDDLQLERYLLGLLADRDADRLDEMSISDDDVAHRLRIVEDDLIDAYVGGALAGERLERFESFYLSSERHRRKVAFARSLLDGISRSPGPPKVEKESSRTVWWLAAAAALIVLAGGTLLNQDIQLRRGLIEARQVSATLSDRAHDLEQQLNGQRAAAAVREMESTRTARTAPAQNSKIAAIALVLVPQTRTVGPMATLAVPLEVDRVSLELRLESNDFPLYQVAMRDPGTDRIVWRSGRITASLAGDLPAVLVAVPAGALKSQHYSLQLDGFGTAGVAEAVGSYVFQVVRR